VPPGFYGIGLAAPPQVFSYLYRRATPSRALDASGMCAAAARERTPPALSERSESKGPR
jgi:hypothetical protein